MGSSGESGPRDVRLAVLIVNYFSSAAVQTLLESLRPEAGLRIDVVVVDNSVDVEETRKLEKLAATAAEHGIACQTVLPERNLGYGAGNNFAFEVARKADPDVVLVANPDTTVAAGSLRELAEFVLAHSEDLVAVRTVHDGVASSGLVRLARWSGLPIDLGTVPAVLPPLSYPAGHFLAVSAARFARLGGFSDEFFLYCEELDLTLRNDALGGGVRPFAGLTAEHEGGLSINAGAGRSTTSYFHGTRSRVLLYRKHRELRPYLPVFVFLRIGWGLTYLLIGRRAAGAAILRAVGSGLRPRRDHRTAA